MAFSLPTLPYAKSALGANGMCEETLDLHHGKHHQAYVTTLNGMVDADAALQGKSLDELVVMAGKDPARIGLLNQAGQHWNHIIFWENMSPNGGRIPGKLEKKINEDFGSVTAFKDAFKAAGTTQFGSGWAWLILGSDGKLKCTKTANGSNPLATGEGKVLLACDVWEHAYYLDFRNVRPNYLANWLDKLANYEYAEAQL